MNTLIIYNYEEQSVMVLLDEDGTILESDYANGMMWTIENSLIKIFGEAKGTILYNSLVANSRINLIDYNLEHIYQYTFLDEYTFNKIR